jgi:TatD DNase family protein
VSAGHGGAGWFDSHCHLQDPRLDGARADAIRELERLGVREVVANATREADWEAVAGLARDWPGLVRPAFGVHPWHAAAVAPGWEERLRAILLRHPGAAVGEAGLDKWMRDPDLAAQERVFRTQIRLAVELERPLVVHCLRAFGRLLEMLRAEPALPARGFLLHSYGGPAEMVPRFAALGGFFSVSPYFAAERKAAQLGVFAQVPLDRLLVETDAPDMRPPAEMNPHPLGGPDGEEINHPANVVFACELAARARGLAVEEMARVAADNHRRLFGLNLDQGATR